MAEFSYTIDSSKLSRGLRPSKRMPRNSGYLVECKGAVGQDGVLSVLDEITRLATDTITDVFPYPQIFVCTNMIIVCSSTKIYEWDGSSLVLKLTVEAGSTWSVVDFYHYAYLSNAKVSVTRNPGDKTYSISSLPINMAMCNFKGRVIIGSPNVVGPGADLTIKADPFEVETSQHGDWV